ncbi:1-acyl-sn-glycerol-3-phosphate acyltransferase [Candidatus Woesearchaeota archaeon]|nr:1-acyl-sn-glycerol-3-phosphate acyltransferase [Candidatus Woesearchaeota archaeon]
MVYPITKFWFYPLNWIMIRNIKGIENIPVNAQFILVSNHEHLIDPFYIFHPILKKLNKKVHFVATPTWWFLGETICRKWAGCIPLFNSEQAYREAKKLIKSSEIVGIFPEGGLRKTKNLKTGAVRLALETKAPILPIGLKSSYIPFNSAINIGKPVYLKKNKKNLKKQMSDLMNEVYRLRNSMN